MNATPRRFLLWLALLASLAATRWVASQDAPADEAVSRVSNAKTDSASRQNGAGAGPPAEAPRATAPTAPRGAASASAPSPQPEELPTEKLNRPRAEPTNANLFAPFTWEAPPPKTTAKPEPPPAPQAPPLPYSYFGKMSDGGRTTVFLLTPDRSHAVAVGDVLDGRYKVEDINDRTLVLTYLPLQQQQILKIGD